MQGNKKIIQKEIATEVSIVDSSKNPISGNSDGITIFEAQKSFKGK